jgi:predicted anti-sigma-YlaC factor YlaD
MTIHMDKSETQGQKETFWERHPLGKQLTWAISLLLLKVVGWAMVFTGLRWVVETHNWYPATVIAAGALLLWAAEQLDYNRKKNRGY